MPNKQTNKKIYINRSNEINRPKKEQKENDYTSIAIHGRPGCVSQVTGFSGRERCTRTASGPTSCPGEATVAKKTRGNDAVVTDGHLPLFP